MLGGCASCESFRWILSTWFPCDASSASSCGWGQHSRGVVTIRERSSLSSERRHTPAAQTKSPTTASLGLHGQGGIRTHGTLLTYTHFPGVRLKPLGHLSLRES